MDHDEVGKVNASSKKTVSITTGSEKAEGMKYGLGIDTGGTYTDAVIYDFEKRAIISTAKSITVKEDLTIGINGAIDLLPAEYLAAVRLVSLSTTLATNACVEGKGSRAKLILIGCDPKTVAKYGHEYGLPDAREIIILDGGHDQKGDIIAEPDWDLLKTRIDACRHDVDAYAVVEMWGMRNGDFERKTQQLLTEWTGQQTICGQELTGELNSLKRAASALLNAQLIPIIDDFLMAIRKSLAQHGIKAPLVIVRGDGSLMSESFARDKPVETLLCGPAASIAGGIGLTGEKNCIIVDMGGTTSDLALVKNGLPELAADGARVGKWKTAIKSIQIHTVGLGGDSLIRHNNNNKLTIGPVRAAPLSWTVSRWPEVLDKIRMIYGGKKKHTISLCEFFYLIRDISGDRFYNQNEMRIAAALKNGPLSVVELAELLDLSIYDINTRRLEQHGVIMRCGLTPTDILHLTGGFTGWNSEAARYGALIMAHQIDISVDELIRTVHEEVLEKLFDSIMKMLLEDDDENLLKGGITKQLNHLLTASFRKQRSQTADASAVGSPARPDNRLNKGTAFMTCNFTTDATLVGIGAPIHLFLPDVAKVMQTRCVIPEHAGVANAIGAITGNVVAESQIIIKPQYSVSGITGYLAFAQAEMHPFKTHDDSIEWAKNKAHELAMAAAQARGAGDIEMTVMIKNSEVAVGAEVPLAASDDLEHAPADAEPVGQPDPESPLDADQIMGSASNQLLLETIVSARAVGKVRW